MPLYRPRELSQFLQDLGRGAKRTLSQNFLIDGNIVSHIVESVSIPQSGTIVEIGSGPGVLTEAFLDRGYSVLAVEKDEDFARELGRLNSVDRLRTVCGDILNLELGDYGLKQDETAIVSNLPYHITTPILHWICRQKSFFCQAVLMMQREVADKLLMRQPSCTQLEFELFFEIKEAFSVSRKSFMPVPEVDSKVISFSLKKELPLQGPLIQELLMLIRLSFSHRRKTVLSTLSNLFDRNQISDCLVRSGLSLTSRPEEISLEKWITLEKRLSNFI